MRFRFGLLNVAAVLVLAGGLVAGTGCSQPDDDPEITGLQVNPSVASITMEEVQAFTVEASYDDGTAADVTDEVAWASSDTSVATIDAGEATPVGFGETTITATLDGESGTATLTVEDIQLESCEVDPNSTDIMVGGTEQFVVQGSYSDGSTREIEGDIEWSSSDTAIVTVDSEGLAEGEASGTADVEAQFDGMDCVAATVTVQSGECTSLTIVTDTGEDTIPVDGTIQFEATCTTADGNVDVTADVAWDSSDTGAATIDDAGEATGVAAGTTTITAVFTNADDTTIDSNDFELTVVDAVLDEIQIEPVAATLTAAGAHQQYTATCLYDDSTSVDCTAHADLTWASSDETVATISNGAGTEGEATAVADGETDITATMGTTTSNTAVLTVDTTAACETVEVTPTAPADLPVGSDQPFTATCTWNDGSTTDVTAEVTWASSDAAVASIGTDGVATGLTEGTTDITATYADAGGPVASTPVTLNVIGVSAVSIAIEPVGASVAVGLDVHLDANVTWSDGSVTTVTTDAGCAWTTSDAALATVTDGDVLGVAAGTAIITATYAGLSANATVVVTGVACTAVTVSPNPLDVPNGTSANLTATCTMSDGSSADVTPLATWTSDDVAVATVTSTGTRGVVTGMAAGTTNINAAYAGFTGFAVVNVGAGVLDRIEVTPASPADLPVGLTQAFVATGVYTDGTTAPLTTDVTWASSEAFATISNAAGSEGVATGAAVGTTNITASFTPPGGTLITSAPVALTVTDPALDYIEVAPATATVNVGFSQQFTATAFYTDGSNAPITEDAAWSTAADTVASVSNTAGTRGLATGVGAGTTTITATYMGETADATIDVSAATLVRIDVAPGGTCPTAFDIREGNTQQFTATGFFDDGSNHDITTNVTWHVTNTASSNGTISNAAGSEGLFTAVAAGACGQTTVYATLPPETSNIVDIDIDSGTVDTVTLSVSPTNSPLGSITPSACIVEYTDGTLENVTNVATFDSTAPGVASISNADGTRGEITANALGGTDLTCAFGGETSAVVNFQVIGCTLTGITIYDTTGSFSVEGSFLSIPAGGTYQYVAAGFYSGGCSPRDITAEATWVSRNTAVATVSDAPGTKGLATAVGTAGQMTIIEAGVGALLSETYLQILSECVVDVVVTPAAPIVAVGNQIGMTATAIMSAGPDVDVTDNAALSWTTGLGSSITVHDGSGLADDGTVEAYAAGAQDVIATLSSSFNTCSGSNIVVETLVTVTDPELVSIEIDEADRDQSIGLATQLDFNAWANYADGSRYDITETGLWNSTVTGVATISNTYPDQGLASAVAEGDTTITVSFGTMVAHTNLEVNGYVQNGLRIEVDETPADWPAGIRVQFSCYAEYVGGFDADVTALAGTTFDSEDPTMVAFTATPGEADTLAETPVAGIEINCHYGTYDATIIVNVNDLIPCQVDVSDANGDPNMIAGSFEDYTAVAIFDDGVGTDCDDDSYDVTDLATWISGDETYVTVSNIAGTKGRVTAVDLTSAPVDVIANYGGIPGTSGVNVVGGCVDHIEITPDPGATNVGLNTAFVATAYTTLGTDYPVTGTAAWDTSNHSIATIVTGSATGHAVGTVTVTAAYTGTDVCTGLMPAGVTDTATLNVGDAVLTDIRVDCAPAAMGIGEFGDCIAWGTFTGSATEIDITDDVDWSSAPSAVLSVNDTTDKGLTEALAAGGATVTAQQGTVFDDFDVDVLPCVLDTITVATDGLSLPVGFVETYVATGHWINSTGGGACTSHPSGGDVVVDGWASWSSTVLTVATVAGPVATTVGIGDTEIEAAFLGVTGSADLNVNNATLSSIVVSAAETTIHEGETEQFTAVGTFSDTSTRTVTADCDWSSSLPSVATVSNTAGSMGLARGEGAGATSIQCAIGTVSDGLTLTVTSACLDHIEVTPVTATWPVDVPVMFDVTGVYSDSSTADLTDVAAWTAFAGLAGPPSATGAALTATPVVDGLVTASYDVNTCTGAAETDSATITVDGTITLVSLRVIDDPTNVPAGLTGEMTAMGLFTDGIEYDVTERVAWVTSDAFIATVDNTAGSRGVVSGLHDGDAVISAVEGLISADANVFVTDAALASIIIQAEETRMGAGYGSEPHLPPGGYMVQLHAFGCYTDGSGCTAPYDIEITDDVDWSSEDDVVVTVAAGGMATTGTLSGTADETVDVMAAMPGTTVEGTVPFTVAYGDIAWMDVTYPGFWAGDPAELPVDFVEQWEAWVSRGDFIWYRVTESVIWSTDDVAVATISNGTGTEGLLTGEGAGSTPVRAAFGTLSTTDDVTVLGIALEYVEVAPAINTVVPGFSEGFDLIGHFDDGSTDVLEDEGSTWTRHSAPGDPWANRFCARVDESGYATSYVANPYNGATCDGVDVIIEACYQPVHGGAPFCSYDDVGGTHEGILRIDDLVESGDDCTDPYTSFTTGVTWPGTVTGSTVGYSNAMELDAATCSTFWSSPGHGPDVWYEMVLTSTTTVTASLCGSSYDTTLYITDACPAALSDVVACNEDSCGLQSEFTTTLGAGTYYIVVDGYGSASGDYTLTVTF